MEIYDTVISYTLWIIHKIILKGEIEIYSVSDDDVYEVDFMNLVVDKADGLKVVDCDNHFCEFTGVHPSKIKQGKLFLHDIIKPIYREEIMRVLCKKIRRMFILTPSLWIKMKMKFLFTARVKIMRNQAFAGSLWRMCQNRRNCSFSFAKKPRK